MTAKKTTKKTAQKTAQKATAGKGYEGFSDEERAAMKEHAQEMKAASRRSAGTAKADAETAVLEKIAELSDSERAMAERVHAIVTESAPELEPRLWYGQPAYSKGGKVVCFFQPASKFKTRYATFGFNEPANLDDGTMWATAFALTELTPDAEARISELVKKSVS
jgi:uncharacterized protein YdhG (YjbR/CyaY superfamily)